MPTNEISLGIEDPSEDLSNLSFGGEYSSENLPDVRERPKTRQGAHSSNASSALSGELRRLFDYVDAYTPLDIELDTVLKPFIPDYVPAIGDIDAFIKVPRPDDEANTLGLTVLDEPCGKQSNPITLDLKLRALSKATTLAPQLVGTVGSHRDAQGSKAISKWISLVEDLHKDKPAAAVQYGRPMPDIDELMQVWPTSIERALQDVQLPKEDLDLSLEDTVKVYCTLLDIPTTSDKGSANDAVSNNLIEALHVMFTLYSTFNSSQHFSASKA